MVNRKGKAQMKERKGPGCFFGALEMIAIFIAIANVILGEGSAEDLLITFFVIAVLICSLVYTVRKEIIIRKRMQEIQQEREKNKE